ncbi:Zinc finger protein [Ceratobasidium theobromae]|uniref:Zinc finger protein n=1 Tax=Ceratobasidium theobromae TaxID=1582974 RepID=A0A5N5QFR9_9AGAM|nr:Zinc finger protein [Ceratobasidium theobromae]
MTRPGACAALPSLISIINYHVPIRGIPPPTMGKNKNKKKNKFVLRPWCWYCEREFEDEKVLMQHQKAKHFKCGHCPRRLNTAGGLAVHIQQVHKLDPEKIENALPGRDGYEVEIFGMEGIPAPDMASYKRRKEEELGLASGTISQPPTKRPKMDYRQPTDAELAAQLAAHKTLMAGNDAPSLAPSGPAVFGAPTAFAPPFPPPAGTFAPPPFAPGGAPIHLGTGPFPPAATASRPPAATGSPAPSLPPPPQAAAPATEPGNPPLRVPVANYTNPPMKDGTALVYNNANQSPASLEESRAHDTKYTVSSDPSRPPPSPAGEAAADSSSRKRARAEDFL